MSRWFPEPALFRVGDGEGAAPAPSPRPGSARLAGRIAEFERDLEARPPRRGARIACAIAGDAARYLIVPWLADLAGPTQRQVLAEHCFREAYGDVSQDWTVRLQPARFGAATLACAIDSALLDGLEAATRARRLKLVSVQPSLMHAFNQTVDRAEPQVQWFVCTESVWTTVLLMSPTEPLQVKQLPSAGLDLARSLDREWLALGLDGPRCNARVVRWSADPATVGAPAWQQTELPVGGSPVSSLLQVA